MVEDKAAETAVVIILDPVFQVTVVMEVVLPEVVIAIATTVDNQVTCLVTVLNQDNRVVEVVADHMVVRLRTVVRHVVVVVVEIATVTTVVNQVTLVVNVQNQDSRVVVEEEEVVVVVVLIPIQEEEATETEVEIGIKME